MHRWQSKHVMAYLRSGISVALGSSGGVAAAMSYQWHASTPA